MNILLVEPDYKAMYVPLGLMKISTYHKNKGDTVKFQKGLNYFLDFEPNIIYITSLFSWYYFQVKETYFFYKAKYPKAKIIVGGICASILFKRFTKEKVKVFKGIWQKVDELTPDYSLFPNIEYSISYTTRGCLRKCPWCLVPVLEPKYIELKNWEKMIIDKPLISFWDNNFLNCSKEHFTDVCNKLMVLNKKVDFNQGLDARLFTDFHLKYFSNLKLHPLRFSFDTIKYDKYPQKAFKMVIDTGITDCSCYVLYNFDDTPEDFYYRMEELVKLEKVDVYPMRYQPLRTLKKDDFIGKNYNNLMLNNFNFILQNFFDNSVIGRGLKLEKFYSILGKDKNEFKKILQLKNIEEHFKDRRKIKEKIKDELTQFQIPFTEEEIQNYITKNYDLITRKQAIEILKRKDK